MLFAPECRQAPDIEIERNTHTHRRAAREPLWVRGGRFFIVFNFTFISQPLRTHWTAGLFYFQFPSRWPRPCREPRYSVKINLRKSTNLIVSSNGFSCSFASHAVGMLQKVVFPYIPVSLLHPSCWLLLKSERTPWND